MAAVILSVWDLGTLGGCLHSSRYRNCCSPASNLVKPTRQRRVGEVPPFETDRPLGLLIFLASCFRGIYRSQAPVVGRCMITVNGSRDH
jgi:hypothetical protein